ncbi:MAG: amino acid ABC transporter substrate-binding protein [Acidisphaera sp.]|nr:amino acid ABC transporter substrate-binding protein [Acidisphaera sp.]
MLRLGRILPNGGISVAAVMLVASVSSPSSAGAQQAASGCHPAHQFPTVKQGALTVSAHPSLPYLDYDQATGAVGGVDGDVLKNIAAMECLRLDLQVVPGAGALQGIESGIFDTSGAGWYITPKRTEVMGMTQPFYYDFTSIVSTQGYASISQLKGKTVGIVAGSIFVEPLQQMLGSDHVRTYQLADAVMNDLLAGRIEAAVLGSGQAGYLAQHKGGNLKVEKAVSEQGFDAEQQNGKIGFPYPKTNAALGKALDDDISTLRENGAIKSILERYGMTNPNNYNPAQ